MPSKAKIPEKLRQEIVAGRCVAFVGAGFSAAARLPTWGKLLSRLVAEPGLDGEVVRYVESALNGSNGTRFEEAAQVLFHALGREEFIQRLRRHMAVTSIPPTMQRRLELLASRPFKFILTTNFDDVLAGEVAEPETFARLLRPPSQHHDNRFQIPGFPPLELRWDGSRTVKLHGDMSRPDSVVLSRLDYRRKLYKDPSYLSFLRSVFVNHTVLYLGFSFTDTYMNELRSEVLAMFGANAPNPLAFAVMPNVPEVGRKYLRDHEGIEVIHFDAEGGDFSGFDETLEALNIATSPVARFGKLLKGKRILWLEPDRPSVSVAEEFFDHAARDHGEASSVIEFAETHTEALGKSSNDYDLVITRWGHGEGALEDPSLAVSLLRGIRKRDFQVPVIVFASGAYISENKPIALRHGAQAYHFTWRGLVDAIERVFDPGMATG